MRGVVLAALLLVGCGPASSDSAASAGARLEQAAVARGIVADPRSVDPVGVYASETDRVCIVRAAAGYTIGASVDYGERQGCVARGTASGRAALDVRLPAGCRFTATLEGERIVFPALLPAECDRACTGRASFAALSAERLSGSAVEAASAIGPRGERLCS